MSEVVSDVCARIAQAFYFDPLPERDQSMWEMASGGVPFYSFDEAKDPLSLIPKAAKGDVEAQRELAAMAAYIALMGAEDVDPIVVLSEGLMFARMAASHGDSDDVQALIGMLSLASMFALEKDAALFVGEALARIELLADADGPASESAATLLAKCAERETPDVLEIAKGYRTRLKEAE